MSTIGDALRARERGLFIGREPEIDAFMHWLRSPQPIFSISGRGGIGKSMLLRRLRAEAARGGREVLLVDARTFEATPDGLARAITGDRRADPVRYLNENGAILMLDTFEELGPLTGYLQHELLPPLDESVGVVLSGRHPLGSAWREWLPLIQRVELESFHPEQAREYIERRGVEPGIAEDILPLAGGHPLALSLAADMAVDLGLRTFTRAREWRRTVQQLLDDMLRDLRDPLLRQLLEAAAVVRQFSEETLTAIVDGSDVRAAFEELCRLSIVKPGDRGLVLHDDVRRILIEDLKNRRPEHLLELRRRARHRFRDLVSRGSRRDNDWLIEEHLWLIESSVLQDHYFLDPGAVWTEPGAARDLPDLLEIHAGFYEHVAALPVRPPPEERSAEFVRAVLEMPGTEFPIARDSGGAALGFGYLLPICGRSLAFIPQGGPLRALVDATIGDARSLPASPSDTDVFYMSTIVSRPERIEETVAALGRDGMKFLIRPALLLGCTGDPMYAGAMEATGFTKLSGIGPSVVRETTADGYFMDLRKVGPDAWVDAITSGRPVPKPLEGAELERELHDVLVYWRDEEDIGRSALVPQALVRAGDDEVEPAAAVRTMVLAAFERARAEADDDLPYRAVELGYLEKSVSHERVAERLNVSRTTFFRLLKRGIAGMARAL